MVKSDPKPLYQKVANITGIEYVIVEDVLNATFKSMREYYKNPNTYPGIKLTYLGTFRGKSTSVRHVLKELINKLRMSPDNEAWKSLFRVIWKYRLIVKDDEYRRNYTRRFGAWHWGDPKRIESESHNSG